MTTLKHENLKQTTEMFTEHKILFSKYHTIDIKNHGNNLPPLITDLDPNTESIGLVTDLDPNGLDSNSSRQLGLLSAEQKKHRLSVYSRLPKSWQERYKHLVDRSDIQMISEKTECINVALPLKLYKNGYKALRLGKILMFLYNIWNFPAIQTLTQEEKINLCINIELSCYTYTLSRAREDNIVLTWNSVNFCNYYHEICARLLANFDSRIREPNEYLIESILNKKIHIMDLPKLSANELCPDKYQDIINRINRAKDVSFTIKTSSMYKCRKCFARECKIENRQNRSLDEGVNLTITCMSCQHQWNG